LNELIKKCKDKMLEKEVIVRLVNLLHENFALTTFNVMYTFSIVFLSSIVTYFCLGKQNNKYDEDDITVRFLSIENNLSSMSSVVEKNKKHIKQHKFKIDMQESEQDKFLELLKGLREDVSNIELCLVGDSE